MAVPSRSAGPRGSRSQSHRGDRGALYLSPPYRRRYLGGLFLLGVGLIPAIPLPLALLVYVLGPVHGAFGAIPLPFLLDTAAGLGICIAGVWLLWPLRRASAPSADAGTIGAAATDLRPVLALLGGLFLGVVLYAMSLAGPALNPVLRESLVAVFGVLVITTAGARVSQRIGHPGVTMLVTVALAMAFLVLLGALPLR